MSAETEALAGKLADVKKGTDLVLSSVEELKKLQTAQEGRLKAMEERVSVARNFGAFDPNDDDARHEAKYPGQSRKFIWSMAFHAALHRRGAIPEPPRKDDYIKRGFSPEAVETVEKIMTSGILTEGGFLVPDQYVAEIIPALRPQVVLFQAGARTLNVPAGVGQVRWPKENAVASISATGETVAPSESTPTTQQVVANPRELRALVKLSMNLVRMANPDIEAFIRDQLLREVAIESERQGLRGLGAASEALGVNNYTNVESVAVGANGGPITYNLITDLETQVFENNIKGGRTMGFITSHRGWREIRQVQDANSRPIFHSPDFAPGLLGGRLADIGTSVTLMGYPIFRTTNVPTNLTKGSGTNLTELYFAQWDELLNVIWGAPEVRFSRDASDGTDYAFTQNLVFAGVFMTHDWVPMHEESFGIIPDMNSA